MWKQQLSLKEQLKRKEQEASMILKGYMAR